MAMNGKAATDDRWQREMRDKYLVPLFYAKYTAFFQFVDATSIQKQGIDTVIRWRPDSELRYVEEKIVRWPRDERGEPRVRGYDAIFLETESCTNPGHESPGWMRTGDSDYLLYCMEILPAGLDCFMFNFPRLKKWFWTVETRYPYSRRPDENRTAGRVVPLSAIKGAVGFRRVLINEQDSGN